MLERLRVRNFALIEELALEFKPGLNILTGETGAGKSILLGALSVLLGERITDDMFRNAEKSLQTEAGFNAEGLFLPQWVEPEDGMVVIQRKVNKGKRPQNFVNQHQTTQKALSQLGDGLVDIHGQHQHQLLLKTSTHGRFLDSFGGLDGLRDEFGEKLSDYKRLSVQIKELTENISRRREQRDFLEFQLAEIRKVDPKTGEGEALKKEQELLASAEKRAELSSRLVNILSEDEQSVLEGIAIASRMLGELEALDPSMKELAEKIREAEVLTQEIWRRLLSYQESIEYSPQRLEEINQRMFALEKLFRKHGVDQEGLIRLKDELQTRINSIQLDAEKLAELKAKRGELQSQVNDLAGRLSDERKKVKKDFEEEVQTQLKALAMPKARLQVKFSRTQDPQGLYEEQGSRFKLTDEGLEHTEFLFSANPGEETKPLARIASGGELSRIMLALKTVLVDSDKVPVLVFDEIDVGIGGGTAETIGRNLKKLAARKQILLVTHLPQIARYADAHFRVSKKTEKGRTFTRIKKLDAKGRIQELARMLGGEEITETVRAHAEELLGGKK